MAVAGYGAALGSLIGPEGTVAGGIIGGVAGGLAGAFGGDLAQDYAVKSLPHSWRDPIEETEAAAEEQHPYASFVGGLIPMAVTMSPRLAINAVKELPPNANTMMRIAANPQTARLFSGAGSTPARAG